MIGRRFGPYELVNVLGRGGMGEVWRAVDVRHPGREVAVKVLRSEYGDDQERVHRFEQEARLTSQLSSPYIVPIHDWGEDGGRLYVVMALVSGTDLGALLDGPRTLPPRRAVGVVTQVARALTTAHTAGLVHRDVKPPNIMVVTQDDGDDHVYLIDFGIARLLDSTRNTVGGIGTPAYMAPEQFDGDADARSDVYSLACVLFQCLTGRRPFHADNAAGWWHQHASRPRPHPSDQVAGLPAGLDEVVVRGMATDPVRRYAAAIDFATAAREALEGRRRAAPPVPVDTTRAGPDRAGATRTDPVVVPSVVFLGTAEPVLVTAGGLYAVSGSTLHRLDVDGGEVRRWSVDLGAPAGGPVVACGMVLAGAGGVLHAVGLDGRTRWRCGLGGGVGGAGDAAGADQDAVGAVAGGAVDGPAEADEDGVLVIGSDQRLHAVDGRGDHRWAVPLDLADAAPDPVGVLADGRPGWGSSSPVRRRLRAFACGPGGGMSAVDTTTGRLVWRRPGMHAGAGHASGANRRIPTPVVADGVVALVGDPVPGTGAVLTVLDAASGEWRWQRAAGRPATATTGRRLDSAGGRLVLRDDTGVVALDPRTGAEVWRVAALATVDLAVSGSVVLCLDWSGVRAFDAGDGHLLWQRPLTVDRSSARVTAGPAAVVVADRRRLVVLDARTGEGPSGVT